jgi:hypothetical protein
MTRIELVTPSLPRKCSTPELHRQRAGDGPRTRYLQLGRLSLYQMSYSRIDFITIVGRGGFEPPKAEPTDLQSAPFDRFGISPMFSQCEPMEGFEPPTG